MPANRPNFGGSGGQPLPDPVRQKNVFFWPSATKIVILAAPGRVPTLWNEPMERTFPKFACGQRPRQQAKTRHSPAAETSVERSTANPL